MNRFTSSTHPALLDLLTYSEPDTARRSRPVALLPMDSPTHETDVHDLSLGVIHALRMVDVKVLSYVQLRRLYAALIEATNEVDEEVAVRSETTDSLGETVRIPTPKKRAPLADDTETDAV